MLYPPVGASVSVTVIGGTMTVGGVAVNSRTGNTITAETEAPTGGYNITNLSSTAYLSPDETVYGGGLPAGTEITKIDSASEVTVNEQASASGTPGATPAPRWPLGSTSRRWW